MLCVGIKRGFSEKKQKNYSMLFLVRVPDEMEDVIGKVAESVFVPEDFFDKVKPSDLIGKDIEFEYTYKMMYGKPQAVISGVIFK